MSGSVNTVILIGNLGRDPEVRTTQSGDKIVNLRLACSESWRDKNTGERREKTEWVSVVIFNEGLAGIAEKYLRKGSKVFVSGSLQTRKWTDQQGVEKYSTEVVLQRFRGEMTLLDSKRDDDGGDTMSQTGLSRGGSSDDYREKREPAKGAGGGSRYDDLDDDIPF